jgi:ABC-type cobalamin/Fe3+-siderophores transport system ATPase subunit
VAELHDPQLALQFAQQVVTVRTGRVFASGPAGEVLAPSVLTQLYDSASGWQSPLPPSFHGGSHA